MVNPAINIIPTIISTLIFLSPSNLKFNELRITSINFLLYKTKASNFHQTLYVYIFFRIIFLVRLWNLYKPHYISICNSTDKATYLRLTDTLVTYPYLYMSKNFENIEKIKNYFPSLTLSLFPACSGVHFAYHPLSPFPTNIKKDIGISDTLYHT